MGLLQLLKRTKQKAQEITVHPDKRIKGHIIYAFTCAGKDYYRMLHDYEILPERFVFLQQFYEEMQTKCDKEYLASFCKTIKGLLDNGKLGETWKLVDDLQYRLGWVFTPDTLMRFASALYFDLNEDISSYGTEYNEPKIELFKKKQMQTYFLAELIEGSDSLLGLSAKDFKTYSLKLEKVQREQKKALGSLQKLTGNKNLTEPTT